MASNADDTKKDDEKADDKAKAPEQQQIVYVREQVVKPVEVIPSDALKTTTEKNGTVTAQID